MKMTMTPQTNKLPDEQLYPAYEQFTDELRTFLKFAISYCEDPELREAFSLKIVETDNIKSSLDNFAQLIPMLYKSINLDSKDFLVGQANFMIVFEKFTNFFVDNLPDDLVKKLNSDYESKKSLSSIDL